MCKLARYLLLFLLLMISSAVIAQKTDKVFLKNGDVLTGEIKSMKFAKLSFDMTGPGTIDIKWEEVVGLRSGKTFQVTLRSGKVLVTPLDSAFFEKYPVLDNLVNIVQIKYSFIESLYGDVNIGF